MGTVHSAMINLQDGLSITTYDQITIDNSWAVEGMEDWRPNGIFLDWPGLTMHQVFRDFLITNTQGAQFRSNGSENENSAVFDNVSWRTGFNINRMEFDQIGLKDDFPMEYWGDVLRKADIVADGLVNFIDLAVLLDDWLEEGVGLRGDIYTDAIVNLQDVALMGQYWSPLPPDPCTPTGTTEAYWQFDENGTYPQDALGNYDLTGYLGGFRVLPVTDPVPNPDASVFVVGDPCANPWAVGELRARREQYDSGLDMLDSSWTLEGWLRTTSGSLMYIAGTRHWRSSWSGWHLWMSSGKLTFRGEASSTVFADVTTQGAVNNGDWRHFALVWDHDAGPTGEVLIYVDGSLVGSDVGVGTLGINSNRIFSVGFRNRESDGVFDDQLFVGQFDEFRFINQALVPAEFLNAQ
jgi:hypothetical protein